MRGTSGTKFSTTCTTNYDTGRRTPGGTGPLAGPFRVHSNIYRQNKYVVSNYKIYPAPAGCQRGRRIVAKPVAHCPRLSAKSPATGRFPMQCLAQAIQNPAIAPGPGAWPPGLSRPAAPHSGGPCPRTADPRRTRAQPLTAARDRHVEPKAQCGPELKARELQVPPHRHRAQ
eukprot:SAG31_NODE_18852_length_620_cov_1.109405_1_plen_171_part_10